MKSKLLFISLLVAVCIQVSAVSYSPISSSQSRKSGEYYGQVQSSHPSFTFQSTSVYSGQWDDCSITPMLNDDGSVNGSAYMGAPAGPRRDPVSPGGSGVNGPGTPGSNPDPGNQQPIGDGLWVLMALAMVYAVVRKTRVLEH